eukprot:SAG22_NODE_1159_length_5326_cov_3.375741_3_plen_94_part_00
MRATTSNLGLGKADDSAALCSHEQLSRACAGPGSNGGLTADEVGLFLAPPGQLLSTLLPRSPLIATPHRIPRSTLLSYVIISQQSCATQRHCA